MTFAGWRLFLAVACTAATFLVPDYLWWPVWIAACFCTVSVAGSMDRLWARKVTTTEVVIATDVPIATGSRARQLYDQDKLSASEFDVLEGWLMGIEADKLTVARLPYLQALLGEPEVQPEEDSARPRDPELERSSSRAKTSKPDIGLYLCCDCNRYFYRENRSPVRCMRCGGLHTQVFKARKPEIDRQERVDRVLPPSVSDRIDAQTKRAKELSMAARASASISVRE